MSASTVITGGFGSFGSTNLVITDGYDIGIVAVDSPGGVQQVTTRTLSWKDIVVRSWGKDWNKPEPGYEWSNGRKFNDGDGFYEDS